MHAPRSSKRPLSFPVFCASLAYCFFFGCDTISQPDGSAPNQRPATDAAVLGFVEDGADNGVFTSAQAVALPASGEVQVDGSIESLDDVDMYALGPAAFGDRVTIEITGHGGLNTVAALFDGEFNLIDANDDRSYYGGQLDPFFSQVVRLDTPQLYVGVAVSSGQYFSSNAGRLSQGTYSVRFSRQPGVQPISARAQLVFLDFAGGDSVQISLQPAELMQPFDAGRISSRFQGEDDFILDLVVDHMRRDYSALQVTLVDGRSQAEPVEPHTTLYFGNRNEGFLGLADGVDPGNAQLVQQAIIYVEDLAGWEGMQPTAEEVAMAIANIASHELGHLLGLEHTSEAGDLMAIASSASQMLDIDADFRRARLEGGVFPVGWQNSARLLAISLGTNGSGDPAARSILQDLLPTTPLRDVDVPLTPCGNCAALCTQVGQ